jgi:hypothetical protein
VTTSAASPAGVRHVSAPALTRLDEVPRHQVAQPFAVVANESVHWSDGFYFTLGSRDGAVGLFSALRLYANTDVMDAFVCVTAGGLQRNVRASRRLRGMDAGATIDDLVCGPIEVDIVEGLVRLRTVCRHDGLAMDLDWVGLHPARLEEPVVRWGAGRKLAERQNFDQVCAVTGWIEVEGTRLDVDPSGWVGVRDHSWGIGQTGGPPSRAIAPLLPDEQPQGFALRQWVWMQLGDVADPSTPARFLFWQCHRSAAGELTMFEGGVLDAAGGFEPFAGIEHEGLVRTGRRLVSGTVVLRDWDGGMRRVGFELTSGPVYLQGGGYWQGWDDGRGRGSYRGESVVEADLGADAWDVGADPSRIADPRGLVRERPDGWAEAFGRCWDADRPDDTAWHGFGHLETVFAGDTWDD